MPITTPHSGLPMVNDLLGFVYGSYLLGWYNSTDVMATRLGDA